MSIEVDELTKMRDALIRARASGIRTVQFEDRRIEYASSAEMAAALADLERRIAAASAPYSKSRTIRIIASKGL